MLIGEQIRKPTLCDLSNEVNKRLKASKINYSTLNIANVDNVVHMSIPGIDRSIMIEKIPNSDSLMVFFISEESKFEIFTSQRTYHVSDQITPIWLIQLAAVDIWEFLFRGTTPQ